jgi:hypothetical protein
VVDLAYRNRGVGRGPLHKLIEIAAGKGLEKRPKVLLNSWGFVPVAVLPAHVKDYCGNTHDLIIMDLGLPKPEAEEPRMF